MAHSAARPLPPKDFAQRKLPLLEMHAAEALVRVHRLNLDALFFGRSGDNRFDDPAGRFGVCYAAQRLEGAFAETFLRNVGATLVSRAALAHRAASTLRVKRTLRLAQLYGPGLARMGATAAVSSGPYEVSQPWACAIHDHPEQPDGMVYRSNHDNGELCVALFDRCADALAAEPAQALMQDRAALALLLDRYRVGLT